MSLNRVRTFIIVALLFINAGLAVFWYRANNELTKLPADTIRHAVKNLDGIGISVRESVIPDVVPNNEVYSYEVLPVIDFSKSTASYRYSDSISAFFLSRSKLKPGEKAAITHFEVPEGITVNLDVEKQNGKIVEFANITYTGDFGFEFTKSGFNLALVPKVESPLWSKKPDIPKKTKKLISAFFLSFGKNYTGSEYVVADYKKTKNGELVICRQTLSSAELDGMELRFFIRDKKEIQLISGKWCFEAFERKYSNTLIDGVNILYRLENKDIQVTKESIVYMSVKYEAQKYYFIPAWSVIFKDNNKLYGNTIFEAVEGTKLFDTSLAADEKTEDAAS